MDPNGNPIDPDAARGGAMLAGLLAGGVDVLPLDRVLDLVPGADRLLRGMTHGSLERVLRMPGVADQLGEIVRRSGGELTIEFAQEALSALSFEAGQGAAQLMDPDAFGAIPAWDAIDNLEWEFEAVMAAGGGMIMLPGTRIARATDGHELPAEAHYAQGPAWIVEGDVPIGENNAFQPGHRLQIQYDDLPIYQPTILPKFRDDFSDITFPEQRQEARRVLSGLIHTREPVNSAVGPVGFPSTSYRKLIYQSLDVERVMIGSVVSDVIAHGQYLGYLNNQKPFRKNQSLVGFHYFGLNVIIGGQVHSVVAVVRHSDQTLLSREGTGYSNSSYGIDYESQFVDVIPSEPLSRGAEVGTVSAQPPNSDADQ